MDDPGQPPGTQLAHQVQPGRPAAPDDPRVVRLTDAISRGDAAELRAIFTERGVPADVIDTMIDAYLHFGQQTTGTEDPPSG